MTENEKFISELADKILKAEPDKTDEDGQYLEKAHIIRILRGIEEWVI